MRRVLRDDQTKTRIYGDVLRRILHGDLRPGLRLVEKQLAAEYLVSRTVIREVLFMLLRDGLVERKHNRGSQVISFTPDDVEDLYEIRKNLELLALRSAIRSMPLEPLFHFEKRLQRLEGKPAEHAAAEHAEIDLALHGFMLEYCRNKRLVSYLENISQLMHLLRLLGYGLDDVARLAGEQHVGLVRAFIKRDLELAERLLAEHIDTSKRNALQMLIMRRGLREVKAS